MSRSSPASALCSFEKHTHTCSASYFLSGPNTWSDQSPTESGQEIELFSTPGWVVEILGDGCALQLTLCRRDQGPAKAFPRPSSRQRRRGGQASQNDWVGSQATSDFTSNFSLSPTKQKKTKSHSPSYIHTQKENFLKREEKKKPGSIFEGKRLFIAAKVLIFFFLPLATI